ncbi:hypothetical protein GMB86_02625 [Terrilactibacillus sp. BCM23-1]|uniref:6-phosphogluconate dehydrogenase NADP-binding domain-containing protein n=1 Tax=Terrilactibacillus tamarindi TaxID=2599694 RepID=A0A6N8CMQ1_9BACI|nr:NAD(P)-binding domain-containing protein [Terrilactibacillus tamarindi]MTT30908.1 hypothetical protein [Terrilactibacillus tamarindi]
MIDKELARELASLSDKGVKTVATIGMTSRPSAHFTVLPRRQACGFEFINVLVSNEQAAVQCMNYLDNKVNYIFVDVEAKKNLDLESLAYRVIKQSTIVPYKPNDVTLEACDQFLLYYFGHSVKNKKLLIYGAGNIGGKLALRLAERGAKVSLYSRNGEKCDYVTHALNLLLPKYSPNKIEAMKKIDDQSNFFDGLISFVSAEQVVGEEMINLLKKNALVLDGGINNFTPQFYQQSFTKLLHCYRLDVRIGFLYSLLPLSPYIRDFFKSVQGKSMIETIPVVSGGVIGSEGDIVVDNVNFPRQLIGIANGIGGLKNKEEYTPVDLQNLKLVQRHLQS